MTTLAVIYRSARGVARTEAHLLKADDLAKAPDDLIRHHGFILGSPADLGGRPGFWDLWARAWLTARLFVFPAVVLLAPLARKAVERLTASH
ncbi:MAG: DUF2798 domain-containing protein [Burkholderiales bacterium]|nr:DUF2798 domain-containing protein [Burkholderiales bacterium]